MMNNSTNSGTNSVTSTTSSSGKATQAKDSYREVVKSAVITYQSTKPSVEHVLQPKSEGFWKQDLGKN